MLKDIKQIEINIPQYDGIPGSGNDYSYVISVLQVDNIEYGFSTVLDRIEEKELIEYLKYNNINLTIKYYDNISRREDVD